MKEYLQWVAMTGMPCALAMLLGGLAMVWIANASSPKIDTDGLAIVGVLTAFASLHALVLCLFASCWLLLTRTTQNFRTTLLNALACTAVAILALSMTCLSEAEQGLFSSLC